MKIDLNLDEIFDEGGSVEDSIKERIIQTVVQRIYVKIERDLSSEIKKALETGIREKVNLALGMLIPTLLDEEFTPVSSYGEKGKTTTVRNQILEQLKKECVVIKSNYSSDQNTFTKVMHQCIEEMSKDFKAELHKEIDSRFTKEALEYAQKALKEELGIK